MSGPFRKQENDRSSMFSKLTPELRRAVDVAIVERCPPTFQAVWMNFRLGELGVTYSAFYRYARRLRDRANLADTVALADDEDAELDESIRKLVSRRLLEVLLNTDDADSIKHIAFLMTAHRQVSRTALQDRQISEKSRIAWARVENERDLLRLKLEELLTTRRAGIGKHLPPLGKGLRSDRVESSERVASDADGKFASLTDPETRQSFLKLLEAADDQSDLNESPDARSSPDRSDSDASAKSDRPRNEPLTT